MNLLDVVSATLKSGGSFKQKDDDTIYVIKGGMICFANEAVEGIDPFCATLVSSILAENWEIVEPEVRITKAQFWVAAHTAITEEQRSCGLNDALTYNLTKPLFQKLAQRLGLEP